MLDTRPHSQQTPTPSPFLVPASIFDEDGFLVDFGQWNEALAQRIAQQEGITHLDDPHWRLIRHVRERFLALGGLPSLRRVCRATGLSRDEVHDLFGGCLPVWRISGLPNPGEEAKAYM
nr:TusE/DsrC/DsvC family sulfur relay protein [Thioalkalivibrio sp.]